MAWLAFLPTVSTFKSGSLKKARRHEAPERKKMEEGKKVGFSYWLQEQLLTVSILLPRKQVCVNTSFKVVESQANEHPMVPLGKISVVRGVQNWLINRPWTETCMAYRLGCFPISCTLPGSSNHTQKTDTVPHPHIHPHTYVLIIPFFSLEGQEVRHTKYFKKQNHL